MVRKVDTSANVRRASFDRSTTTASRFDNSALLGRKFPEPVANEHHRWNQEEFPRNPGNIFSYLDRHAHQIDDFRRILPQIVERNMRNRTLDIAVIGPATGEEMATIQAAVLEEFEANERSWGHISQWKVSVQGKELEKHRAEEANLRLSGQRPFTYSSNIFDGSLSDKSPQYKSRVAGIVRTLNRNQEWAQSNYSMEISDARSLDVIEGLTCQDYLQLNFVGQRLNVIVTDAEHLHMR